MVDVRGLDPRFAPSVRLSSVRFLTYTGKEIEQISCKRITNISTFDSLLHPNAGGLYDPALGPCDKVDLCGTCGLNYIHCPGHLGSILLPLPVYHPVFFVNLYSLLRCSCWMCHRLYCAPYRAHFLVGQLKLIEFGLLSDATSMGSKLDLENANTLDEMLVEIQTYVETCKRRALDVEPALRVKAKNLLEFKSSTILDFIKECNRGVKKCSYCSAPFRALRQENRARIFLKPLNKKNATAWREAEMKEIKLRKSASQTAEGDDDEVLPELKECSSVESLTKQTYLTPLEVRVHVSGLWENQKLLLNAIVGCSVVAESSKEEGEMAAIAKWRNQEISPADVFFLDVISVPPSRFRPIARLGEKRFENPQTVNLHKVLMDSLSIQDLMAEKKLSEEVVAEPDMEAAGKKKRKESKKSFSERLQFAWMRLQTDVNCLMDSNSNKTAKVAPNGIKQILEKKEGLFRKHMMGKRVDFAARSVISPDPYIDMDEIGIPMVFATKLTYPQPVTHWNVKELRQAVVNGPNTHPGATHVQNEDGSVVLLSVSNSRQRVAIAKKLLTPSKEGKLGGAMKKVFRHLKNGDILLMNRQPTLHKPSIMAHKARVLPGEKTLRLHYANCKTYNADFDGDEMNAHFPQNELARAEAYGIVSTHHQYLVPKDGTPLSGLIQDHVVSGLLMTVRGRMFSRLDYMHLVFSALPQHPECFHTLPPCIMKPEERWSGKQVVSTVLLNIVPEDIEKLNLISKAKIAVKEWGRGILRKEQTKRRKKMMKKMKYREESMTESEVVFCQGELMCGVLDKSQFGASQYGFVHSCYELYGGAAANLLLSALGRLFTTFLQLHGFTLGVEDILVRPEADEERHAIMAECRELGPEATAKALGVDLANREVLCAKYEAAHHSSDTTAIKALDYFMKKKTDHYNNSINAACVPAGLHKPFPSNSLQLMVQAGAKGSTVNCMQISSLLGQIELEGQRPPMMASGRFLPSFLPYDPSPRAGGFVDGRFLTGIRPQEYFFHCMAGREGLVDTAVKTSRSGYLQRCLIKHLEGICVGYDMTVRDCDGSVIQFLYGEDGMDISKTRFLVEKQFPFLVDNYRSICHQLNPESAISIVDSKKVIKYQKKVNLWNKRHRKTSCSHPLYYSGFHDFCEKHLPELEVKYPIRERTPEPASDSNYRTEAQLEVLKMWYEMPPMARESCWKKFSRHGPIPANAHLSPDRYFGSVPERMSARIAAFVQQNPEKIKQRGDASSLAKVSSEMFESLVHFKCLRALADPGEAVGLLAAQSIGEPSTQMTLNTFHFAGRGEMNVTLGIPRLREILMTASANIKTPSMDVPLLSHEGAREQGEQLRRKFTRVCLKEVLEKVEVWESIAKQKKGFRYRAYKVKFSFLPYQYYKEDFVITPEDILLHVEKSFLKKLVSAINREIKAIKQKKKNAVSTQKETEVVAAPEPSDKETAAGPPDIDDIDDENADFSGAESEFEDASAKLLSKKQQLAMYEDAGESDEECIDAAPSEAGSLSGEEREVKEEDAPGDSQQHYDSDGMMDDDPTVSLPQAHKKEMGMNMDRVRDVLRIKSATIVGYSYDTVASEWCEVTLKIASLDAKVMLTSVIGSVAAKSVVFETTHIKKGFLSESTEPGEQGLWRLKTDGVNLQELWLHSSILDLNKAYTNNIHAMANVYGVEAACKAIIKEISGVFNVYGIAVDYRHLSLIADYMTFEGSYKPFNRVGMESNSSPFQKMSFETTMQFLKNATIAGETDPILSPSACLVAGRVVKGGTGSFELLQKLF